MTVPHSPVAVDMPLLGQKHISSPYGMRTIKGKTSLHRGTDFSYWPLGADTPVFAPWDGYIIVAHNQDTSSGGKHILIEHGPLRTRYLHLNEVLVRVGDYVKRGQQIGVMGFTGEVVPKGPGGAHLHFDIIENNGTSFVDPMPYLRGDRKIGPRLYINDYLVVKEDVMLEGGRIHFQQPSRLGQQTWVQAREWSDFLIAVGLIKTAKWGWDQAAGIATLVTT